MEDAVSETARAFAAAHRSDEDCQAYISASRSASSVIAKAKAEAWQETCSFLSFLNQSILSFVLSLALLPHHLPPLLTFPTVLLPRSRHRTTRSIGYLTFLSLAQRPCIAESEANCPSSNGSHTSSNLISLCALSSLPPNFSRLPQISHRPLPLAGFRPDGLLSIKFFIFFSSFQMGSWTILATIDFSKAFVSVRYPTLFHKLILGDLSPCFARRTQYFLSDPCACVAFQKHDRRSLQIRRGVP